MNLVQNYRSLAALLFVGFAASAMISSGGLLAQPAEDDAAQGDQPRRVAIRVLTEGDFPPFNYYDEDNVLTGFNVDITRAICLELDATCDIQVRPWAQLLPALANGEAEAVIASHSITPNTLKVADFTDRYYYTPARFAAKRGAAVVQATPEGMEGLKIGVAKGTAHEAYLRTFFRDSTIRVYDSVELTRDALATGEVDLIFDDGISLAFWLNGTSSRACCEFKGGPFAEPRYFGDGVGIAVKRDDKQLKTMINTALKRVRESGRYEELLLRYFPLRVF